MSVHSRSQRKPMTITEAVSFELIVKRSRFLTYLEPVTSKEGAQAVLEKYRNMHWDAVHHCYAWRLGDSGLQYRMSDDGEPSGSAGKPMLFALQQASLCNVIVVVVRYFGGIKLGIGPLARTYADSAKGAIEKAHFLPIITRSRLRVHCLYDDVSRLISLLEEVQATYDVTYADTVTFDVHVPSDNEKFLQEEILSRTNARAGFSKITTD